MLCPHLMLFYGQIDLPCSAGCPLLAKKGHPEAREDAMSQTFRIRRATPEDAPALTMQRRWMLEAMGERDEAKLKAVEERFVVWVRERLERETFLAWLMVDENDFAVAGASLLL